MTDGDETTTTVNCYIYELVCKDPRITDKYLGYTTEWKQCMAYHAERSRDPEQILKSTLYFEIHNTGGWKNWSANVLTVVKGRKDAVALKTKLLKEDVDSVEYPLNVQRKSLKPAYIVNPYDNTQSIL